MLYDSLKSNYINYLYHLIFWKFIENNVIEKIRICLRLIIRKDKEISETN